MKTAAKKIFEILIALSAWTGLAVLFLYMTGGRTGSDWLRHTADFFLYFTIQSNIFAAVYFTIRVFLKTSSPVLERPIVSAASGAVTLYLFVTGVFFFILLRNLTVGLGIPFRIGDTLLHYVVPVAAFAYWLIDTGRTRYSWKFLPLWMIYPLFYFLLTLSVGLLTKKYPYYFINPVQLGYPQALLNAGIILAVIALMGVLLTAANRIKNRYTDK